MEKGISLEEELRASGDPKFQHLSEELHVEISAFATPAEAHARIAYALAEVRRFLVPDYNDDIRQEQMWEMQVLSSQRNNGKTDDVTGTNSTSEGPNEDSLGGESMEGVPDTAGDDHPALRGVPAEPSPTSSEVSPSLPTGNGVTVCSGNGVAAASNIGVPAGRKRPLLTGGPRTSMTPTKRTVMSLLARARAAQAKQMPATFQRGTTE
ncbi:hypothetical protein FQR65_LT04516 [Abscondita terminalis]|nr:hypothetical protein FQR65_LT04516 [Abscondita terminalis]